MMPKLNYDYHYRASENTTSASRGRLDNADSAWYFHYEKFFGQKAFFTVDLGAIHLISGFQSQDPHQKLHRNFILLIMCESANFVLVWYV